MVLQNAPLFMKAQSHCKTRRRGGRGGRRRANLCTQVINRTDEKHAGNVSETDKKENSFNKEHFNTENI
jgi:hypothetical protein